jgi:glutamyl-tRNA synthetase
MPKFAHLPLILRPDGKGKLSKRDGAKFGFPVFPLDWAAQEVLGFDGQGFLPQAVLNFLALLGWSPSENREVLSLQEMIAEFDLANVHKSGARFDFEKAKWFNQQYLIQSKNEDFAALLPAHLGSKDYLTQVCGLMKERVYFLSDIAKTGHFFFRAPDYEQVKIEQEKDLQKKVLAKWPEVKDKMSSLISGLDSQTKTWTRDFIHDLVQELMPAHGLKTSEVFPFLRLAVSGSLQGPDLFAVLATLDSNESITRLKAFRAWCNKSVT